jgi:hypothetical protein
MGDISEKRVYIPLYVTSWRKIAQQLRIRFSLLLVEAEETLVL